MLKYLESGTAVFFHVQEVDSTGLICNDTLLKSKFLAVMVFWAA